MVVIHEQSLKQFFLVILIERMGLVFLKFIKENNNVHGNIQGKKGSGFQGIKK
jgi:hypothetical protein